MSIPDRNFFENFQVQNGEDKKHGRRKSRAMPASAEPPQKYRRYKQCANKTHKTYKTYLSMACILTERIILAGCAVCYLKYWCLSGNTAGASRSDD